jgi:hypothetical protein
MAGSSSIDPSPLSSAPSFSLFSSDSVLVAPTLTTLSNLTIVVGGFAQLPKKFPVVLETLCLASPMWRAMLRRGGPWLENDAEEVAFPDDDPESFELVLQIIHGQFHSLPDKISTEMLVQLAVLCDKYQMANVIRKPFVENWMQPWKKDDRNHEYEILAGYWSLRPKRTNVDCQSLLFVAWTFGLESHFTCHLRHVIAKTRNGEVLKARFMPDGMEGKPLISVSHSLQKQGVNNC